MISPAKKMTWIGGGLLALATLISVPASFSAYAAGLGRLSVNSSLGQPLSAEIELLSLQSGEFESLSARVASPDSFRDARIEYVSSLRLIRFAVDKRPNGQPFLKITSIAPVNEPFLDMLVELNWPSGRLLREYPILLDPPGFNEARVAVPAVAAVTPVAPVSVPVPAEMPEATTSTPVELAKPPEGAAAPADTYGPVKKGDTLNKIATQVKSDSVSLEQMLVALYRENQTAFIDSNMNRLKAGQILRVPAASDVANLGQSEAQKEIKIQVANWNAYRESVASMTSSAPARADSANQASGKIVTAKPEKPGPAADSKDVLKLSKVEGAPGKTGSAGAKGGSAQDQVDALKEEVIARDNALREAKVRVAELEKQIQDMRKFMELKGVTPSVPAKPGAAPAVPAKAIEAPKPADTKLAQVTPAPAKPVETPKPAEAAKPVEPPKADTAKAAEASKPVEPPKPAEAARPADQKPAAPKAAPKAAPAKASPPEPDVMDTVMENLPYVGGGLAVVLVGGGLFAFMRKRKAKDSGGPLTRASSILPSDLKPSTSTGKPAGGLIDTGNSSFLTDFDKAGPGTIDTDEVDPVAEAEVYIAYGRDAQAEEILKEAMGRDKNRHEITLKLLEIYYSRKSVPAFENLAKGFKQNVGETHPMWAKAAAMGAQIDPGNSLYAGFGQKLASTAAMPATAVDEAGSATPPDLDFDLGFNAPKVADVSSPATEPSMRFDLDLAGPASTPAPSLDVHSAAGEGGLDFDLGLDRPAASATAVKTAKPGDTGGFDFDLSDLSLDKAATPVAAPARDKTPAFNLNEISLDLDAAGAGGGDPGSAVGTKLELAKAYVEIGDKDGAKEILQEVLKEGNAAQQKEAKSIIASL
jgi:pilus assembly protein FimV